MRAPFEKFKVAHVSDEGMWQINVWVKLGCEPENPDVFDWYGEEMRKLGASRKFIEDAIREKLERAKAAQGRIP